MIIHLNPRNRIFILLVLLILSSCSKKDKQYSYAFYYEGDIIPSTYQIREIQYQNGYRTDIVLSSKSMDGPWDQVNKEKYLLLNDGLERVIAKADTVLKKPFLTTANNDCIEFLHDNEMDDVMSTTLCFLGRENLLIGNKEYENAYKFKKKQGKLDGVESIVYYDTDFIILKEEYVSGYTDDYRIVRLDTMIKARH